MKRFRPIAFMKGAPTYDPSVESLSGWWRGNYANPWTPTASAGASGTNGNLAPGTAPGTGTLSSKTTAKFTAASSQYIASANNASTFLGGGATPSYISLLARSIAQPAPSGAPYSDSCMLCLSLTAIRCIISFSSSGAQGTVYNGGYNSTTPIAFANNTWCAFQFYWDGIGTTGFRVNRSAFQTVAFAGPDSMAGTGVMNFGANYNAPSVFADLEIADVLMNGAQAGSAGVFNNHLTYYNSQYGLAL